MDSLVDLPVQKPALSEAVALLARTVRSKYFKMTDQDVQLLSEMSPSLVIMSRAARTENGAQLVRNYFDGELGKEMIRFWEEDER